MTNGKMIDQLLKMAGSKDITPEQATPLMLAALAGIYAGLEDINKTQKKTDERIDDLESADKRFIALIAGIAGVLGGTIPKIIELLASVLIP